MQISVGRVVHLYSDNFTNRADGARGINGVGKGPYVAICTQVFPDAEGNVRYANLIAFPPFAPPEHFGSVPEANDARDQATFWEWPPRV